MEEDETEPVVPDNQEVTGENLSIGESHCFDRLLEELQGLQKLLNENQRQLSFLEKTLKEKDDIIQHLSDNLEVEKNWRNQLPGEGVGEIRIEDNAQKAEFYKNFSRMMTGFSIWVLCQCFLKEPLKKILEGVYGKCSLWWQNFSYGEKREGFWGKIQCYSKLLWERMPASLNSRAVPFVMGEVFCLGMAFGITEFIFWFL